MDDSYFIDFVRGKKTINILDDSAETSYIAKSLLLNLLYSCPHSLTFDIYSDKIFVGEKFCKCHAILCSPTCKLENYWVGVVEKMLSSLSFGLSIEMVSGLDQEWMVLDLLASDQFFSSHRKETVIKSVILLVLSLTNMSEVYR